MKTLYKRILLGTLLIIGSSSLIAQQRVVTINGIVPGGALVYDQIYKAITDDAPNRVTNKNVVYQLKRGQVYLNTSTINSIDYNLHIRAEPGTGARPLVFHTLNNAGASAAFITARMGLTLENIEVDGKHSNGTLATRIINMSGANQRCILKGCYITNDRGAGLVITVDGTKIYLTDCVIGNMGHQISLGGNGRAIELRNTTMTDTVVVQNCTIYNLTDRVFRNMAPIVNYFKMDHNTIYNVQGYHGSVQLGKTRKAVITNNIFANPLVMGNRYPSRWRAEQTQPDKDFAVITHDSLSAKLTSFSLEMRNNNIYHEKMFVDFFNQTPPNDSIGNVRPFSNFITRSLGAGTQQAYFSEELKFKKSSNPQMLYDFVVHWVNYPKAALFPNNFSEIYPYEWDVSYSTTSKSYRAADSNYPVGDLNAWPALKAQWAQGIVQKSASLKSVTVEGVSIDNSYPNPFLNQTTIYYSLTTPQKVEVSVFNSVGQLSKVLVNSEMNAGSYSVVWDGNGNGGASLPKGIYFLQIAGEKDRMVKKIIKN